MSHTPLSSGSIARILQGEPAGGSLVLQVLALEGFSIVDGKTKKSKLVTLTVGNHVSLNDITQED